MDYVSPIIDIISHLWDCSATHRNYLCELKQNLNALKSSFTKLEDRRDDVKERVHAAESNPMEPAKRTNEVSGWLGRVEILEQEIENILKEGVKNEGGSCIWCWGRKNCCSGYKLGKIVVEKLNEVNNLWNEGVFQVLVDKSQLAAVREIPAKQAVGIESTLEEIWRLLTDEESPVRIIGLYGMGGVGKTTLLKNVHNEFLKRKHQFDKIIWVVVSQVLNIENIQKQIGKSLGLSWPEETNTHDRAKDIMEVLKNKKFVLLLDDIWERVDLQNIGIPYAEIKTQELTTKYRAIFSTRSESVCGFMQADETIKVNCLDWDGSWRLFQQNVSKRALSCHPDVSELTIKVAEECLGLPLALITIGQAMASKKTLREWQHALNVLQKSASDFSGVADKVLAIMKYSYDNLENEKLKSCFLYFSLYPEDYSIWKEELIKLWIGEEFLDEVDDIEEAYIEGHDVIESLKSACLLETGNNRYEVKMHDVVRDLAIWIASDLGRKKGRYLVQVEDKPKLYKWEKAEKISLVNKSDFKMDRKPNCLNLSTLLLLRSSVDGMSDDFFQLTPMLKVLDIRGTRINKVPDSIFSLKELQYLNLSSVSGVIKLRPGSLVCLTKLKVLDLINTGMCNWEEKDGPSINELESLNDLNYLGISIETGLALRKLVSSHKLHLCTKMLFIRDCKGITTLALEPPSSSPSSSPMSLSLVSLGNMARLNTLKFQGCFELKELRIVTVVGTEDKVNLFTTLEKFSLHSMLNLKIVLDVPPRSTFSFANLKYVAIKLCHGFKDLTWLTYAQNLETLALYRLDELEEVISDGVASEEKLKTTFSRLNSLSLNSMPNLKRICNQNVKFLSLEHIQVNMCPELKKLPFNANSVIPRTLEKIEGVKQWWERLEWEDEATESNLAPYFREFELEEKLDRERRSRNKRRSS